MNVFQMSVSAGVLILTIAILRTFTMNKLPKTTFLAFWGLALGTLVIPYRIPSHFSVYNAFNSGDGNGGTFVSNFGTVSSYSGSGSGDVIFPGVGNPFTPNGSLADLMIILWLLGAALCLLFFAVTFYKSHKEIRTALPMKRHLLIDKWLSDQHTFRTIQILESDKITTPLSYGIFKPKIILPKTMDFDNDLQIKHILTHELIHIKRFDTLWKMLLIIVTCIHWFNPMVWVLYVLMRRDLEISCDEKVIKQFGENTKAAYAMSLIQMAEQRAKYKYTPLYNGFSKNAAEERIVSIMKFKKTSIFTLVMSLLIVGGATATFASSGTAKTKGEDGAVRAETFTYKNQVYTITYSHGNHGKITVKDADENVISKPLASKIIMAQIGDEMIVYHIGEDGKLLYITHPGN